MKVIGHDDETENFERLLEAIEVKAINERHNETGASKDWNSVIDYICDVINATIDLNVG